MMMINNDIWSKFDEVMERELSGKDRVSFYKLPSHIRVMIWNMKNREEKIENLKKDNKYNKKLLSFELKSFCEWSNNVEKIIKPSFQVICPRVGQVIVFDDGNVWINQDNASSYTWLEDRKISTKKDMIEIMIEEMNIGFSK